MHFRCIRSAHSIARWAMRACRTPRAADEVVAIMTSYVFQLPTGPRWRVLIAHQRSEVRHVLRTLIEAETIAIVEVAEGEAALAALVCMQV